MPFSSDVKLEALTKSGRRWWCVIGVSRTD